MDNICVKISNFNVVTYDEFQNAFYLLDCNNYIIKIKTFSNINIPYICGKLTTYEIIPLDNNDLEYIAYKTGYIYDSRIMVYHNVNFNLIHALGKMDPYKFLHIKHLVNNELINDLLSIIVNKM